MFQRLRWEIEMTALTSALEKAAHNAKTCGLSKEAIGLAMCIAAVTYLRTEGLGSIEDELVREARRVVPRSDQLPSTGVVLV